jgi:cytochrome c2
MEKDNINEVMSDFGKYLTNKQDEVMSDVKEPKFTNIEDLKKYVQEQEDWFECEHCHRIFHESEMSSHCRDEYDAKVCEEHEYEYSQDMKDSEDTQREIESDYWRSR